MRPVGFADLFEEFWRMPSPWRGEFFKPFLAEGGYPAVDVAENDKEITVTAELPGLEAKDVQVSLEDDTLLITGEKKFEGEEKKDNYQRIERSYGMFSRSVPLSAQVRREDITARFDKGVLKVTLPKAEPGQGTRTIPIES
jgi:HSP20 family protein